MCVMFTDKERICDTFHKLYAYLFIYITFTLQLVIVTTLQRRTAMYKKCCCNLSSESQSTSSRLPAVVAHNTEKNHHSLQVPKSQLISPNKIHNLNTPTVQQKSKQHNGLNVKGFGNFIKTCAATEFHQTDPTNRYIIQVG